MHTWRHRFLSSSGGWLSLVNVSTCTRRVYEVTTVTTMASDSYSLWLRYANIEIWYPRKNSPRRTTRKDDIRPPAALHVATTHPMVGILLICARRAGVRNIAMADNDALRIIPLCRIAWSDHTPHGRYFAHLCSPCWCHEHSHGRRWRLEIEKNTRRPPFVRFCLSSLWFL